VNPRILAIDKGSNECGFAYLDGDEVTTDLMRPKSGLPWAERMDYIAEQLIHASYARSWAPDVVAIEDVVLYVRRFRRDNDTVETTANVKTVLTMGETRGYLMRLIRELFPNARIIDIHPSETKAATGAPRDRIGAKAHTMRVVAAALGRDDLSFDEADAVAVGWAARAKLDREHLERLANQGGR
jgi:Holliday junction resolvasome RuvABC endonuclease subunit